MSDIKAFIQNTGLNHTISDNTHIYHSRIKRPRCVSYTLTLERRTLIGSHIVGVNDELTITDIFESLQRCLEDDEAEDNSEKVAIMDFFGQHLTAFWTLGLNN